MSKKVLLLITLSLSVATGGFLVLHAQDPQNPSDVRRDPPVVSANTTTQTDLSGTYTGTFNCEPLGLMGETTLTITGNDFTTADGKTGRIVASTTGGYTAVVLQMGGSSVPGATGPTVVTPAIAPVIVSMRGRKSGNRLILTPVSGTTMRCSFTPGRGTARGRRNPRTTEPATPAATGTEVANPATPTESPSPAESPMPVPEQTPSPIPSPTVSPTPMPTPSPEPMPNPSPEPMPSPTPGGSPTPMPAPTPGEPMPTPSPGSSPSPTPSPSPRW